MQSHAPVLATKKKIKIKKQHKKQITTQTNKPQQ